jgi:hypothetical protein
MKPDPLRIEFRKIGGSFIDGPKYHDVFWLWGCFIVQPETKQEFLLSAGTQDKMFGDGIARLEGILARLKEHKP